MYFIDIIFFFKNVDFFNRICKQDLCNAQTDENFFQIDI